MNNTSRDSFEPSKNYEKVIFSQQRAVIDFELNELQDRLRYNQTSSNRLFFGDGPVGDAFLVEAVSGQNKVTVRPGSLLHQGSIVSLTETITINLSVPVGARNDLIYLEWWLEEVDSDDDPDLKLTPSTPETATRLKLIVEPKVAEGGSIGSLLSGRNFFHLANVARSAGETSVDSNSITDLRVRFAESYISRGGFLTNLGAGQVRLEATSGKVFGVDFSLSSSVLSLADDLVYFIYVDESGAVNVENDLPYSPVSTIAKVQKDGGGNVSVLEDLRNFSPAAVSTLSKTTTGGTLVLELSSASDISLHDPVCVLSNGKAARANSSLSSRVPVVGVSLESATAGGRLKVLLLGVLENSSWSFGAANANIYLNGTSLSPSQPTTEGHFSQRVGLSLSSNSLLVLPSAFAEEITNVPKENALSSNFMASSVIPAGRVVASTSTDRTVRLANPADLNSHIPLGVTQKPISGISGGPVVTFGELTKSDWDWSVGAPVYLSATDGNLVQKPTVPDLVRGVEAPIRLDRRVVSGVPSTTDFVVPSAWLGRNEIIFEDGLVRVRDTDYLRMMVGSLEIIRFNYAVASDVEINAVFSLEEAGLSLAYTLESASLVDPRIFQVPVGAGPNQLVWLNGIALRYGAQYTRAADIITLKPDVVVAPGVPVVAAFSTAANSMLDIVRLPGPFLDPVADPADNRWIAILPEAAGRSYLLFVDGILLEPGDYLEPEATPRDYLANPDQKVINLNISIDPEDLPVLSIAYSSENVVETGTHRAGYTSVPEMADCIDTDVLGQGTRFILPLGADPEVIPYVNGLAKEIGITGDPSSGDFQIETVTYSDDISLYQVKFNYPVTASQVAMSYAVRGGGMSSPRGTDVQDVALGLFSFSDSTVIPSGSWVWMNGKIKEFGVDYEILSATKQIHFFEPLSLSETYSVRVSIPVNAENMTAFEPVNPSSSDNKSYFLPNRLNTGKSTLVSLDGSTLVFGKDYYRSPNASSFTVRDGLAAPNFSTLSQAPLAVWTFEDNANNQMVLELSGLHNALTNSTLTSAMTTTGGLVTRGFDIDGSSSRGMAISTLTGHNFRGFSVWFKPNATINSSSSEMVILADNNAVFLSLGSAEGTLTDEIVTLKNTSNGRTTAVIASGDNVSEFVAGRWYHIAVRYNTSQYEIWIDGVKQTTTASATGHVQAFALSSSVRFASTAADKAIDAILDEIALWQDLLSAEDVTTLYNNGNGVHHFYPISNEVLLRRPDLYTTKPVVGLVRSDSVNRTFSVLNRSGYVDTIQNPSDLTADSAYLEDLDYKVYVFDLSTAGLSLAQSNVAYDLWSAGHHVITLGNLSTTDTYPITGISAFVTSSNSSPSTFHIVTDDLRDVEDLGGGVTGGNSITGYREGFIPLYTLNSDPTKTMGLIGESPAGGIWFHDSTGGLGRNADGMHLLLNVLTYMSGRDLLRLPVMASSSKEVALSGVSEVFNLRVGHAVASDTIFVNIQPEFSSMVSFGGMADFVPLSVVSGSSNQDFYLPEGSGFSEVVAVDGIVQRPNLDYIRESNLVRFVSATTGAVSASVSRGGMGMSTPQILANNAGNYFLPSYVDQNKKIWVFYDGMALVENVHYVVTSSQLSLIGGLDNPTTMMFSYSLTEDDMSSFMILPQTTDPLVYNLPADAGDHIIVTKGIEAKKALVLGSDYTKTPGNTSIVLVDLPSPSESIAVSYSKRAIQQLLPTTSIPTTSSDSYWKDPVATEEALPSSGNSVGDVRLVNDLGYLFRYTGDGLTGWESISGSSSSGTSLVIDGTLEVSGSTLLDSTLVVSGASTLNSLVVQSNTTVSGDLMVSGLIYGQLGSPFVAENTRYVAKNGSDVSGNGSSASPYETVQAALDSLPAGGDFTDYVIYIYPGVYNEEVTVTRTNTHLVGLQSPNSALNAVTVLSGVDFVVDSVEPGGMFQNRSSITNIQINGSGSRHAFNFLGTGQVILHVINCQIYQNTDGYSAIYMNNTALAGLSRLILDRCIVQNNAADGHCLDLVKGDLFEANEVKFYRNTATSASSRVIKLTNNSVCTNINTSTLTIDGGADYAVEIAGTGNFTASFSYLANTSANKSIASIASGRTFTSVHNTFNVPVGTGYVASGPAGSVFAYSFDTYLASTSFGPTVFKYQLATDTTTSVVLEGSQLYFTDSRAQDAAVVNATSGTEINKAPSVAAFKSYVSGEITSAVDNRQSVSFVVTGTLTAGTKKAAVQVPMDFEPQTVIIRSDSAADLDIIIDINKVDATGVSTSLFTQLPGDDKRPVLPAGDLHAKLTTNFDGNTVADSCVLVLDVDQAGTSGSEGGDFLYVTVVGVKV